MIRNIFITGLGLLAALNLCASEQRGVVKFGGLPLPGATVSAAQGDQKLVTITDSQGEYSFADVADGVWKFQVEMLCFATIEQDITVTADAIAKEWELKLLPMDQINAIAGPPAPPVATPVPTANLIVKKPDTKASRNQKPEAPAQNSFQRAEVNASSTTPASDPGNAPNENATDLSQRAQDGFLINGSSNNGASSPFSISNAFGNNRRGPRSMYTGSFGFQLDNSAFDARSYSLTGVDTPKPGYNRFTGLASFGGPLKIPHLLKNGPNVFFNYQWTRNRSAITQPGLMPTAAERLGQGLGTILDPLNGAPFGGNVIPPDRISSQARALLNLYPSPNFTGSSRYNYQVPIVNTTHQDSMQSRINKAIGRKDQIAGTFAFQSTRSDQPNLFEFLDTTSVLGLNAAVNWRHSVTNRLFLTLGYQFSRLSTRVTPYFANRENVSGKAGIGGNNQDPANWGPPALTFSSGIAALSDGRPADDHNETNALSGSLLWNRGRHNVTTGGDFKRLQFNSRSQQDPRGTFTFTGAASGSAFADFLLGVPDTSSIAFGNADKYFRTGSYDAYVNDDWRVSPEVTLNFGVRWEYSAPITELYGRLVNLDIAPGFTAATPVIARDRSDNSSLIHPDKHGFQPRIGLAWRPISGSSMIVRAGYGVTYNTSVYQAIAAQMAQQSPLSTSLSVQNTAVNPLTLANGFIASSTTTLNTFAVDPNFLVGYAQTWQASVQQDLPGALVMTATYLGIKGTRGMQEFLPNTFPQGPCVACPHGFAYLTSNGNSTRESGSFQLRRRLHSGLTATAQYTFAKAIDDATLGGRGQGTPLIAQDWLNLSAERALSNFDQRHLLSLQAQYTTGMGIGGGTLLNGWKGGLFKDWTIATQITAGSGLPLTPTYLAAVPGTGVTGSIRPDYTGASIDAAPSGLFLNPAAYAAAVGHWGNAGRDSITGPSQFALSASLGRTFRLNDRLNGDLRIDATNALNHVAYTAWNTTITSAQFGLPLQANAMRSIQTTFRVRF